MTPNRQNPLKPEGTGACRVGWGLVLNTLLTPLFPFPEANILLSIPCNSWFPKAKLLCDGMPVGGGIFHILVRFSQSLYLSTFKVMRSFLPTFLELIDCKNGLQIFFGEDTWQQKFWQPCVHYQNMPISTFYWFFVFPKSGILCSSRKRRQDDRSIKSKGYGVALTPTTILEH